MVWVWVTAVVGGLIVAAFPVALLKVDARWRAAQMRCCRCLHDWRGRAKLCELCGARGMTWDPVTAHPTPRMPTHDWQGSLDTVELPLVEAPGRRLGRPRLAVERAARRSIWTG